MNVSGAPPPARFHAGWYEKRRRPARLSLALVVCPPSSSASFRFPKAIAESVPPRVTGKVNLSNRAESCEYGSTLERDGTMRLTTTLKRVPLSEIHTPQSRDIWRPASRCAPETLTDLVDQIQAVGWVEAVVVRERPEGGYELLDGERRIKAERSQGSTEIDAVVVQADDATAAAITLLAQLPKAKLPAIHRARLVDWVRQLNLLQGGQGTHEEVGEMLQRHASTVSRHETVQQGLPPELLAEQGLTDDDLVEVPATVLRRLARLPRTERRSALTEIRVTKQHGGDPKALARCTRKLVSGSRGRPKGPFSVTNRKDGRFKFSLRADEPRNGETAREALRAIEPLIRRLTTAAEVESLDEWFGLQPEPRARRTFRRIRLALNDLAAVSTVNVVRLLGSYETAGLGSPGPGLTK